MVFLSDNVNVAIATTSLYIFFMMRSGFSLAVVVTLLLFSPVESLSQASDTVSQPQVHAFTAKSAELAGTLSWILPGLGQIYNGNVGRGLLQMELFFGGIGMVAASHIGFSHESITPAAWISVGIIAGTFVWSVIDAVTTAERINSEGKSPTHLLEIRTSETVMRFDLGADRFGARASIVLIH